MEHTRTGLSVELLKNAFHDNLLYVLGRADGVATKQDFYQALAFTIRDRMLQRWVESAQAHQSGDERIVCYLSAEFLVGRHLNNNLVNLGIREQVRQAMEELGHDFDDLIEQEEEPGLGNGGLGRLAACYLDSLSTLNMPAIGYGIRYEFGIFDQAIRDGWQIEITDKWLQYGNPWEIARPAESINVCFGGRVETGRDANGRYFAKWIPNHVVVGIPYDTPIIGYSGSRVNTLRLWRAEAHESFDFDRFNHGDYFGAVHDKVQSETISKILYPNDEGDQGKQLRLTQQYFFTSCALQDIIRMHLAQGRKIEDLDRRWAAQMNDTHPSIAVAELMRLLIDEHSVDWDPAWEITRSILGYTNHTLLPEALERWPLPLFANLLPRHLQIIYEINQRFLNEVKAKFSGDGERVRRMSIIDEGGAKAVRMANLATIGSHAVNGVAALHTDLLKRETLRDFAEMLPERFHNVTNGVTPRRWMVESNPELAALITSRIGGAWIANLDELSKLEALVEDADFRAAWQRAQRGCKTRLAAYIESTTGSKVNPDSLFDAQVKRIHEYKRQHLNVLHLLTLYYRLVKNPGLDITPRTFLFGGKAAPGYHVAKLMIRLINGAAEVVNTDPHSRGKLQVIFLADYNVSLGQRVYPAADLSEQISTAGKEASGTGNMKFSLNGALTIGTLDGANVEIRDRVGHENFFLFGLTAPQVNEWKSGGYRPRQIYEQNANLREVLDGIASGAFSRGDASLFRPLIDSLLNSDPYMLLADYDAYVTCQDLVGTTYRDKERWLRMSILNTARMGYFSSDRSIREYADKIWHNARS